MTGFVRVAAATPKIRVADCAYNAEQIIALIKKAESEAVRLICMPELCVTGATCGDLFSQMTLLENAKNALFEIVEKTKDCRVLSVVGLPIEFRGKFYNAAAVFCGGKILGFVPKKSFCENDIIYLNDERIPFGSNIVFQCSELKNFILGETVVVNPSALCETVGSGEKRRSLIAVESAQNVCAIVSVNAGYGESTTDAVYSGHNLICENGAVLMESPPFGDGWAVSEIDLHALVHARRNIVFEKNFVIPFSLNMQCENLTRNISPSPFMPCDCEEILNIQAHGLAKRLEHTGANAVLGISGGLDSTLALLVTIRAYEILSREKSEIIAVTMPCFGTTERTKSNAHKLCETSGIGCREIYIAETVKQHLRDIKHDESLRDITYENAQARIRTLVLMDLANKENGIVIGSGNLSELSLGFATYNGDHMSMYGVNAGVPKTIVRYIVEQSAKNSANESLKIVLCDILATPVSPELLPPKDGEIVQQTEDIVGPYELHDFFIYHFLCHGRDASQIFQLACVAFEGKYSSDEIQNTLKLFYRRFFSQQFKRSCMPDSPQVFSISLSPRNGWQMPSDAENIEKGFSK
ncbi:MAG: NAD(+) synthase [Clostridiales bacterium]|jgi:NAD+ synthase (glutamine-hydrolysing)|nr:NAD(+) synthase [Clostridiales bacterium]